MFCTHCGKEVVEESSFCASCGKGVISSSEEGTPRQQVNLNHRREYTDGINIKLVRKTCAVIFLMLAVLLLLSLISYHPGDSSFNRYLAEARPSHNLIGVCGSYTADALFRLLGLTALLLPLFFSLLAMTYFRQDPFLNYRARIISFFVFMASVAGLISHLRSDISIFNTPLQTGGLIGDLLTHLLSHYFNPTIALLLFSVVAIISMKMMVAPFSPTLMERLTAYLSSAGRGIRRYLTDRKGG